jgi:glycosyltransferase involved in cell wall biosynthesis
MQVTVVPADRGGCGCYRLIWPSEILQARGYDVHICEPGTQDDDDPKRPRVEVRDDPVYGYPIVHRLVGRPEADVIVFQRPLSAVIWQSIPRLQAQGVKCVVEIDDDFTAIDPKNPAFRSTDPRDNPSSNRNHLFAAIAAADLVTVSTLRLAKVYSRWASSQPVVLPNYVPEWYTHVSRETAGPGEPELDRSKVWIGWTGSVATHPYDLQVTHGAIQQVLRNRPSAGMAVVGTGSGVMTRLGLSEPPLACNWMPIEQYPKVMAQFDVGIAPLTLTPFNHAKSWLKGLEFASVGVPFVASPTEPYLALANEGIGRIAGERSREWVGQLSGLLDKPDLRKTWAEAGRLVVRERFTIEGHAESWWEAWEAAWKSQV